jgi:tetratricopeptide (TPR) repeat protein
MNKSRFFWHKVQWVGATLFLAALIIVSCDIWRDSQRPLFEATTDSVHGRASTLASRELHPSVAHVRKFDPAYLLQIHSSRLPELQAWATNWESQTTMDLTRLANWIAKSDLSAVECLQIGEMIAHDEGYPAGKVWIAAGYQRAVAQMPSGERNRKSLPSLISALASAERRMDGHADAASLIEQITSLIMRFGHTNNWDQTPEWARIYHADALLLEGRNVDAKAETDLMNKDAQTNFHWSLKLKWELKMLIARIPFEPEANSPLDVLNLHHPKPKNLLARLAAQQTSEVKDQIDGNGTVLEMNRLSLLDIIRKSELSALECLRISDLMADRLDAEAFASVGTDRAISDLKNIGTNDLVARPMLNALKRVEERLWESPGSAIDRGATLEKITSILMQFAREAPWDETPEWARIGHGEALYMQQRYSEALGEANQVAMDANTDGHFNRRQKSGIDWLQALVLFDTGRYSEAVPHLEATARCIGFAHSKDAWPMWAVALAKSGDSKLANRVFDDWIRQDRPPVDSAAHVLEAIQH